MYGEVDRKKTWQDIIFQIGAIFVPKRVFKKKKRTSAVSSIIITSSIPILPSDNV